MSLHRRAAGLLLFAAVYVIGARLGTWLAGTGPAPSPLFPPTGIALAVLVCFGWEWWPAVLAGSTVATLLVGVPLPAAVAIGVGALLEALVGVAGLSQVARGAPKFTHIRDVLALLVFGGVLGPAVAATVGYVSLRAAGLLPADADGSAWSTWALGDGLGVLVMAPPLLVYLRRPWRAVQAGQRYESLLLYTAIGLVSWLVLAGGLPQGALNHPYLVLPVLVWTGHRLGPRGAATGTLVFAAIATWAVKHQTGPFMLATLPESLLFMQSFTAVSSVAALLVAAASTHSQVVAAELERLRGEAAVRAIAERYRQMFEGNRSVQLLIDPADSRIVDANPAACAFYGYPRDELLVRTLDDIAVRSSDRAHASMDSTAAVHGASGIAQHQLACGDVRDVEVHSNEVQIDGQRLVYAIVHDITDRLAAEHALRRSEERLRLVLQATNDTVWDWDLRTGAVWWNQGIQAVFGHQVDGLHNRRSEWWAACIHPDDRARIVDSVQACLRTGAAAWSGEYRFMRGNGSYAHVLDRGYVQREAGQAVRMLGAMLDVSEQKREHEYLAHLASHDSLTDLPNRAAVRSSVEQAIDVAARTGTRAAVLVIDLDGFKEVNDRLGHRIGDLTLQAAARRWRSELRNAEVLGRLAGDEFAVVIGNADHAIGQRVAQRLTGALEAPLRVADHTVTIGASVGVAVYPADGLDPDGLLSHADAAMYRAKQARSGASRAA